MANDGTDFLLAARALTLFFSFFKFLSPVGGKLEKQQSSPLNVDVFAVVRRNFPVAASFSFPPSIAENKTQTIDPEQKRKQLFLLLFLPQDNRKTPRAAREEKGRGGSNNTSGRTQSPEGVQESKPVNTVNFGSKDNGGRQLRNRLYSRSRFHTN